MSHISYNTGNPALPDMSALALGHRAYISGNALFPVLQLMHVKILKALPCRSIISIWYVGLDGHFNCLSFGPL